MVNTVSHSLQSNTHFTKCALNFCISPFHCQYIYSVGYFSLHIVFLKCITHNVYKWNNVSDLSGLNVILSSPTNLECLIHHAQNCLPDRSSETRQSLRRTNQLQDESIKCCQVINILSFSMHLCCLFYIPFFPGNLVSTN